VQLDHAAARLRRRPNCHPEDDRRDGESESDQAPDVAHARIIASASKAVPGSNNPQLTGASGIGIAGVDAVR
jgi:hypothetical protein